RRAAFEARVNEVVRSIGDESVRKYYAQDFQARLRQLMSPPQPERRGGPSRFGNFRDNSRGSGAWQRPRFSGRDSPISPEITRGAIVRGFRSALPPRGPLTLLAVVTPPWLLKHHAEEFAELEFLNPDAEALRKAILEACHDGEI